MELEDKGGKILICFDPVIPDRAKILILGSFPSPLSFESGFYYGHPRNRFWPVLASLLSEERPISVEQKKLLLIRHQIALWDVLESCEIKGASDASIRNVVVNPVAARFADQKLRAIFFNGAKAEELFKRYQPSMDFPTFRMPSTSPANAAWSFERLREKWAEILPYLTEEG